MKKLRVNKEQRFVSICFTTSSFVHEECSNVQEEYKLWFCGQKTRKSSMVCSIKVKVHTPTPFLVDDTSPFA